MSPAEIRGAGGLVHTVIVGETFETRLPQGSRPHYPGAPFKGVEDVTVDGTDGGFILKDRFYPIQLQKAVEVGTAVQLTGGLVAVATENKKQEVK